MLCLIRHSLGQNDGWVLLEGDIAPENRMGLLVLILIILKVTSQTFKQSHKINEYWIPFLRHTTKANLHKSKPRMNYAFKKNLFCVTGIF